ncbi:hypothetical protein SANA_24510 [Gottschalkiaceae bacterium SANA]|nr:hypothetical protein SANA_24510 [Gottschalkiaceae bacterium SANA]
MLKKKNWVLLLMMFSLITVFSSGCEQSPKGAEITIDPDMTGFDDFMMSAYEGDQYLIVYGSQGSETDTTRLKNYAEYLDSILNFQEEGQLIIESDVNVTEADLEDKHIILLGNPETNSLFAQINDKLPIQVIDNKVEIPDAGWTIGEETTTFTYLIPNPLNQSKYLWVIGASKSDYFSHLRFMTMNLKIDDYLIKADERTRYSGRFSKASSGWTILQLEARETIGEFESADSKHFVIRYSPVDQQTKENIRDILQEREIIYEKIADQLGFEPDHRIDIDIYMTEEVMEHYVGRDDDFLSGLSYEVHKQGQEDLKYKEKIAKIFLGELGISLDQMTRDGLSFALVAEKEESEVFIDRENYLPLTDLTGPLINRSFDSEMVRRELRSFFQYLIEHDGMDKAIDLYQINGTMGLKEALQQVYGKDLLTLEGEWINEIDK